MQNSYRLFLLAAEEMNFTKAAKKAFVTQQCLSNHIKKIEEELNIRIFERSPRLALTPAGEAFYETVRQIELLEDNLTDRISEIRDGCRGEITFGINATRARILLPDIFEEYNTRYPNVKLSVILDDTHNLEKKC